MDTRNQRILLPILLIWAVILLPGILGSIFGWFHIFIPVVTFFLLHKYGFQTGGRFLLFGTIAAFICGIVFQIASGLIFSLSLIPCGYTLAKSIQRSESVAVSGIKAVGTLAASWLVFWYLAGIFYEINPYSLLLETFDQGIDEALVVYKRQGTIPVETLLLFEQSLQQVKEWIPKLMPGILMSGVFVTVWLNMILGNRIINKFCENSGSWQHHKYWQLPEKIIWVVICSAILALLPIEPGRTIAINILILLALIYCFQGFSIIVFYFDRWSVPRFLRIILYILLLVQSFGTLFLSLAGIADVWLDIRKIRKSADDNSQENSN